MKYAIIAIAVLSVLLLMAGCARKIAPPKEAPAEVPSTPAAAAEDTSAAAQEIEQAIGQAVTEDLDLTNMDTLDQDLQAVETAELG